jgi:hypothetical protein
MDFDMKYNDLLRITPLSNGLVCSHCGNIHGEQNMQGILQEFVAGNLFSVVYPTVKCISRFNLPGPAVMENLSFQ